MPALYRLPCPHCDHVWSVATPQAGDTLKCVCGHEFVVPTMRDLRQLELVESATAPEAAGATWRIEQGITFVVGCLLIFAAGFTHWRITPQRAALPIERPPFEALDRDVQQIPLMEVWQAWEHFRDNKLDYRTTPQFIENRAKYRELSYYLYAGWTAGAIGLALIAISIVWPFSKRAG